MENCKKIKNKLKHYFSTRNDVAFVFLFGSYARGTENLQSDVDIAVYFYPNSRYPLEYEQDFHFETEDEIWADLERLLGKEVELLVLNRVSASVSASAIRGIPVIIKDWNLYFDFMEIVTLEAEDFTRMLADTFIKDCSV